MLLNYDFTIEYVNTRDFGQADALFHLIASQRSEPEDYVIAAVDAEVIAEFLDNCSNLPVSSETIRIATTADRLLQQVIECTRSGRWPEVTRDSPLWHYYNRRDTLTTTNDCLLTTNRIVIPKSLQRRVLSTVHKAHPGKTRMKMLARSYAYWPSLDAHIEQLVQNCDRRAAAAKNPVKAELNSWPKSTVPWERVHADFAGPVDGNFYLVIVDAYSKWPEIIQMNSISRSATISALMKIFAQFGNPQTLVADNGTQFTSTSFSHFCRARGITHLRSPPFHPQSNGQAERFVETFNPALVKLREEESTVNALQTFLMAYRSTPCPSEQDHLSPAENFLGRQMRTVFDLMIPQTGNILQLRDTKMEEQFNRHHGARRRHFEVGDAVYVKDYRGPKSTWIPGIVVRKVGNATFSVRCGNHLWTRHINQLQSRKKTPTLGQLLDVFDLQLFSSDTNTANSVSDSSTPTIYLSRSTRIRRAPKRLHMDTTKATYRS